MVSWRMADLLNTLQFSHVTNGRASPDYASNDNWFIGGSSMLFWAVGMVRLQQPLPPPRIILILFAVVPRDFTLESVC